MDIEVIKPDEYDDLHAFYFDVIDGFEGKAYHPCWKKDIYPSVEDLHKLIAKGEFYAGKDDGRIITAMAFNNEYDSHYDEFEWPTKANDKEIFVLHMLAVLPDYGRRGIAKRMVGFAIENAKSRNGKAIRLDVLKGNIPANNLYESMGFQKLHTVKMWYPDTGFAEFELYELAL